MGRERLLHQRIIFSRTIISTKIHIPSHITSVADRQHFDDNRDPTFYFYADNDPTYLTLGQIFNWQMLSLNERTSVGLLKHIFAFLRKCRYRVYHMCGTKTNKKFVQFKEKISKILENRTPKTVISCTIRILGKRWLQDRIRQNYADPTGSGSRHPALPYWAALGLMSVS